mmetsp:Transcript_68751/g.131020  ORF Transcript_68751/g.131020 Transcript_68751/m.131020 type:complete len:205 (-) Transcript_68751:261-875(-)
MPFSLHGKNSTGAASSSTRKCNCTRNPQRACFRGLTEAAKTIASRSFARTSVFCASAPQSSSGLAAAASVSLSQFASGLWLRVLCRALSLLMASPSWSCKLGVMRTQSCSSDLASSGPRTKMMSIKVRAREKQDCKRRDSSEMLPTPCDIDMLRPEHLVMLVQVKRYAADGQPSIQGRCRHRSRYRSIPKLSAWHVSVCSTRSM